MKKIASIKWQKASSKKQKLPQLNDKKLPILYERNYRK